MSAQNVSTPAQVRAWLDAGAFSTEPDLVPLRRTGSNPRRDPIEGMPRCGARNLQMSFAAPVPSRIDRWALASVWPLCGRQVRRHAFWCRGECPCAARPWLGVVARARAPRGRWIFRPFMSWPPLANPAASRDFLKLRPQTLANVEADIFPTSANSAHAAQSFASRPPQTATFRSSL